MIKRALKYKHFASLGMMIFISCLIQVLAVMKSSLVAGYFGTSTEMDSFNFANSLVTFIFGFAASGVSTIIIPNYVKKRERKEVDTFLTVIVLMLLLVSLILVVFRSQIFQKLTMRDEEFVSISGNILIILLVSSFFSFSLNVTSAYFQCVGKYNTPKVINLISQLVVVSALIVYKEIDIYQYALLISLGLVINLILDSLAAVRNGWRYKPTFFFSKETMELFKRFLPIVFSTGVYSLSLMVDSAISSRLDQGKITILNYSGLISGMVNTIIAGNLITYFYPKIVSKIEEENNQSLFWNLSVFLHFIICLIIAGFSTVGREGISILFEHGRFSHESAGIVFQCGLLYVFGQQTNIIRDLLYRYFYAKGLTKIAARNSVIAGTCNIVLSLIFVKLIGIYGIVLGTVVASFVSLTSIMFRFRRSLGFEVNIKGVLLSYCKNGASMIITILAVYLGKKALPQMNDIVSIFLFGTGTVLLFLGLSLLIHRQVFKAVKNTQVFKAVKKYD